MKKITSLLFAGIIAMAFASVSDAATTVRTVAPKVNHSTVVNNHYVTNHINGGTRNENLGQVASFSTGWYFFQNHGHNGVETSGVVDSSSTEGWLNAYQSTMANQGWTLVSQGPVYNADSRHHYRTDSYRRTITETKTDVVVTEQNSIVMSPISYEMHDGQLVAVRNAVETKDITTTTNITTTTVNQTATVYGYGEPITLDTTNTGKITTAKNEWLSHPAFYSEFASKFDFTGDGIANNCEWLSDNPDALLCMPVKGQINGVTELFGNLGGYANGYDKLSVLCDKDGNGVVEGSELEGLMLWVDSNRNGVADMGELKTLDSYGITKFYTDHENFVGKYETSDGQTHTMWAWFPSLQQ
jgi:hypothetical protein